MMQVARRFALTVLLSMVATAGTASTLGFSLQPDPEISVSGSAFNAPGLIGFDFSGANGVSTDPAPASDLTAALTADLDATGALGFLGGAINIGSSSGLFLGGIVTDVRFSIDPTGQDHIGFVLETLTGDAAGFFTPKALALVSGEFGSTVNDIFGTGFAPTNADLTLNAIIPLPPALVLMLSGLAFLRCATRANASVA